MKNYRLSYCCFSAIIIFFSNFVHLDAFKDADYDGGEV